MGLFDFFKKKPKYVPTWPEIRNGYDYPGEPEDYFTELFEKELSEYEVRTEVSVIFNEYSSALSYIFTKEGKIVYVAILCPSYYYKRKALRDVMASYEEKGIPVHRYYRDFRNDKQYVCDRVRSAIK